jgi:predicted nuclease of predicted toxin-antitoxin system
MKFKIDENLPVEIAILLIEKGHNATTVYQENLNGAPDSDISIVCQKEKRTLVTLDTDFADIHAYPPQDFPGLIILRLKRQDKLHVLSVLNRLIMLLPYEPLDRHLWIVDEKRVRIRGGEKFTG